MDQQNHKQDHKEEEITDQFSNALVINRTTSPDSEENEEDDITINDHFLIFDHKTEPKPNHWYILPSSGHTPLARVGHAAVFIPSNCEGVNGSVVSVGGANPDGTFSEINILDLNTLRWDLLIPPGFRPRYEHSAFCLPDNKTQIYVFGGADMVENMNDLQVIDLSQKNASTLKDVSGTAPCARTYRCHSVIGNQLFVYGGGRQGSDPVSDRQMRVFDVATNSWSSVDAKGQAPKSRQGHSCVALCYDKTDSNTSRKCLFIHGGMAGNSMYDDVHILDLETNSWSGEVKTPKSKPKPCPRAAHVALPYRGKVVIFGGLGRDNVALNDLWLFDIAERHWRQIQVEGAAPPARLDTAACIVSIVPKDLPNKQNAATTNSSSNTNAGDYLLITGGMNTEGDVFSDCFIFRLDSL